MSEQLTMFDPLQFERQHRPASGDFACLDCGVLTNLIAEYYVLRSDVWLEANPADAGMLCVGCVEARLQRRLTPADFTDAPVNASERVSDRLWSRIRGAERDDGPEPTDWDRWMRWLHDRNRQTGKPA